MKLGFLGAGKMATALARGFIHAGLAAADSILASDPYEAARNAIAKDAGIKTTSANPEVLKFASVILLAVKPDQVNDVLAEARAQFTDQHLLISIAAGVTLARMEAALPPGARVIRVMPNTPALVGASASAFASGKFATAEDAQLAQKLFSSVGVALQVKESLLDAEFTDITASVVRFERRVTDIALFAHGLVCGTPLIEQIRKRDGDPKRVIDALANAFVRELKLDKCPLRMQALLFDAS